MKTKLIGGIISIIVVCSIFAGWYIYSTGTVNSTQETRTIIDSTGDPVEIPADPERIIALRSGIVETIIALGAEDTLVGIDESTKDGTGYGEFPIELCPELMDLSCPVSGKTLNIEEIIALEPDVILIGGYGRISWLDELNQYNLTVVVAHFEELGNFTRDLKIVGEVVNKQDKAEELANYVDTFLADLDETVGDIASNEKVTAYYCSHDVYSVYGCTTFEHVQIVTAGGINVGEEITTWLPTISAEQLITWNPEVIFTLEGTDTNAILTDEQIQAVSAIENNKVYSIPESGWDFGSLRSIFAIKWVASKLYPAKFSGVNITNDATEFYQAIWGVDYDGASLD
ncbi:MAG: ABC transporter substrate-binding protein [Candidatus Bathyarchaeota archaeon]|nr:ABC transporter substrate-binding protein [Candidatus Bathyarchaeum sp.]